MLHNLSKLFAASLLAIAALAQDGTEEYTRMADVMANYGYTWEAIKVSTEDGYTLTTFHITGSAEAGDFSPS